MYLLDLLVGIFDRQGLGALDGFHGFLRKLVGIHIGYLLWVGEMVLSL